MEETLEAPEDRSAGQEAGSPVQPASPLVSRLLAAVPAAVAIAIMGATGSFVFMRTPVALILGPIAGLIAALAVPRPADAAVAAGIGSAAGFALARLVAVPGPEPLPALASGAVTAAVVGACVGAFAAFASSRSPRLRGVLAAGAVCLLVGGLWLADVRLATTPASDGTTFAGMMSAAPPLQRSTTDEALFLRFIERVRAGEPYYRSSGNVMYEMNKLRVRPVDLTTPLSFRLPTLYVALSRLPPGGIWLVYATLALASVACVAAYVLATRFLPPAFALIGAAAVAGYYGGHAINATLLATELWAGGLGLVAVALLVAGGDDGRSRALPWAAAAAALAAALIRELAAPFVLVGLVTTLASAPRRERREWLPWALALAVALLGYALHAAAALAVIRTLPSMPSVGAGYWIHLTGLGLPAAVSRSAGIARVNVYVTWLMTALAVIGVLVTPRGSSRLALGSVVAGGAFLLFFLYPSGYMSGGLPPGSWGDVVFGTILACVPLAFARIGPLTRESGPQD